MQKIFEIVAVAQLPAKSIQNRSLAAVDGGGSESFSRSYVGRRLRDKICVVGFDFPINL